MDNVVNLLDAVRDLYYDDKVERESYTQIRDNWDELEKQNKKILKPKRTKKHNNNMARRSGLNKVRYI